MKDACLVFDCMETLIDMTEIPDAKDYALWAYEGSGVESLWQNFDTFWESYDASKKLHFEKHGPHAEQDLIVRLGAIVDQAIHFNRNTSGSLHGMSSDEVTAMLFDNFWSNYLKRCYVRDDVLDTLKLFKSKNYSMGVVSNFTVRGGVEEILEKCGLHTYFQFIHTSVHTTYRKPHPNLFFEVLRSCGCESEKVFYLGDDYECDYVGAGSFGFNTYLLDRENRYQEVENRVTSFSEFAEVVFLKLSTHRSEEVVL